MSTKATWKTILDAVKSRRSYYSIKASSTLTDDELGTLLKETVNACPTPHNSQTTRGALITGKKNADMWQSIWDVHSRTLGSAEHVENARAKFESAYMSSYGTYVFFVDENTLGEWLVKQARIKDTFKEWTANASGMLQFTIWTALECAGMGANLQHFPQVSPSTTSVVREYTSAPDSWTVTAMIPFGEITAPPKERTYLPIEDKIIIVK